MREEFLHYLWKYCLYNHELLRDREGNQIIVHDPGQYNRDAGPDFFNARLLIGGTVWAGNVEIHTRASHFDSHGHNANPAFDNVILHVVAENDRRVFNTRGEELLTVKLDFDSSIYDRYLALINNPAAIACQDEIKSIDSFHLLHWVNRLAVERLIEKTGLVNRILDLTSNDWEETLFRMITRYFGFRVNAGPFEMLATTLPYKILRKHGGNIFQIEALLFGTAGLLADGLFKEALTDSYYCRLTKEYRALAAKYSLTPMHGWLWKFSRLRPVNFPTIRISQLACLFSGSDGFFARVLDVSDFASLRNMFRAAASEYWDGHYVFGRTSQGHEKSTGIQAADIILVNAVVPVVFAYGAKRDSTRYREKALGILEKLPPEENSIINEWTGAGVNAASALESQGLLQLRNNYCRKRRCLDCAVGSKLIGSGKKLRDNSELLLEP